MRKEIKTIVKEELQEVELIVSEEDIKKYIYEIRGTKVMLDFDLARIYGYSTKTFNQQVKNNIGKFEGNDFMFRLTKEETHYVSRLIFLTLKKSPHRGGNYKYMPYAFTEQGVYMLMTVLKGELATK